MGNPFLTIEKNLKENTFKKNDKNKLYRIIQIEDFFTMMKKKSLIFKRPKLWNDSYEDFISKELFITEDNQMIQFGLDMVYAQCWSINEECDGMWKSFASIDNGIKIETSIDKLYQAMFDKNPIDEHNFIGKVLYISKNEIDELLYDNEMHHWLKSTFDSLAQVFFIKRKEFSYEKEVRAIILDFNNKEDTIKLKINPLEFITKIIFAPKMSEEDFICYQCKLVMCYGFDKEIITRSGLYDEY